MDGWDAYCEEVAKAAEAWKKTWPNHCPSCLGWGGHVFYESHGFAGGGAEQLFEPCGDCTDAEVPKCGRCGTQFKEEYPAPCHHCGWNHDDGVPEP